MEFANESPHLLSGHRPHTHPQCGNSTMRNRGFKSRPVPETQRWRRAEGSAGWCRDPSDAAVAHSGRRLRALSSPSAQSHLNITPCGVADHVDASAIQPGGRFGSTMVRSHGVRQAGGVSATNRIRGNDLLRHGGLTRGLTCRYPDTATSWSNGFQDRPKRRSSLGDWLSSPPGHRRRDPVCDAMREPSREAHRSHG